MANLEQDLKQHIEGEVRFDKVSRKVYSVDASIYEIEPVGVVLPKHKQDLTAALEIATAHCVPIVARGAATGIAGGCIGKGLVLDLSKYLNRILDVDYQKEYAICEPGVVQDRLNEALAPKGYRLGPDTSTGNRATIGGMLANNAAGSNSIRYGKMVDHVEGVEILLSNGKALSFSAIDEEEWKKKRQQRNTEGHIYREVYRIREEYRKEIEKRFPNIPRRISGYNLDELIKPGPPNLAKIIAGSEGTLGIATKIKMHLCKRSKTTALTVIHFEEMQEALRAVPELLSFEPLAIEMIDRIILQTGKSSPLVKDKLSWLQGNPAAVLAIELDGESHKEVQDKLTSLQKYIQNHHIGYAHVSLTEKSAMKHVWAVRKAGLGLLLSKRTYNRAIAFIEDVAVAPERLTSFMEQFQACLRKFGKEAGIYGHVGAGCLHIRPYIDMRSSQDLHIMQQIMEEVADILLEHKGALSGEHGDGLIRSWLNKKMFGEKIMQAFAELKAAFDPDNLLNPGKVVHSPPLLENLRMDSETQQQNIPTFLDFSTEGGFALSADMCNGNGQCRKEEGLMCPSFHASGDEYHTTRARAQALRAFVNGRLAIQDFTSQDVYDVLDLCLECKGCKTECPSQVDMAKMKAEFLFHYQEEHGYSLRNRLFGNIGKINRMASPIASIFNATTHSKWSKKVLEWVGISPQRSLPAMAPETFSRWLRKQTLFRSEKRVVLFNDTFNEFHEPDIGKSAFGALHALGYEVIVPKWQCCSRPLISKGMLKQAKKQAAKLVEALYPFAQQNLPIIGLEPSCILTLRDDLTGLLGNANAQAKAVAESCLTFDEFLFKLLKKGELSLPSSPSSPLHVSVHGHCYQKALVGMTPTLSVLHALPSIEVKEIPSGCCGMAGSFGYEKEHYDFSLKIGEKVLFPTVRNLPNNHLVIANGFSCRSQILHSTGRQAHHIAEIFTL